MQVLTYPRPETGLEVNSACRIRWRRACSTARNSLWSFTDEAVQRAEIGRLYERIDAHEDASSRGDDPDFDKRSSEAAAGRSRSAAARRPLDTIRIDSRGRSPAARFTWDDLGASSGTARGRRSVSAPTRPSSFRTLQKLGTLDDINSVVELLR